MNRRSVPNHLCCFDYENDLWHSHSMEPQSCDHTIHHVDSRGFLAGSWTIETTKTAARVVCEGCGKFYGYLAAGTLPPAKPPQCVSTGVQAPKTGSSSCSVSGLADRSESEGHALTGSLPKCPVGLPAAKEDFSEPRAERRAVDFAELRRRASIAQVLEVLEFTPVARSGYQLRGPCPVHRSTRENSRVFSVNLDRNVYRCFKPSCDSKGNQLDLYAAVTGLPLYDAAIELCEKLGIDVPWKEAPK